jgi:hypothetical protein
VAAGTSTPSAEPVGLGGGEGPGAPGLALGLDQGGRQDRLAARDARQPALLLLGAPELGDGQRAQHHRLEDRHRGRRAAHLLHDPRHLQEAQTGPAVGFGNRDAEQARLGELLPQGAVEARPFAALDLLLALVGRALAQDLGGEVENLLLLFGVGEIHARGSDQKRGARGKPRPKRLIRSRWISLVPPPKVRIRSPR